MLDMPSKKEFTRLYIEDRKSPEELADKYFVSTGTIANWIKRFKISRNRTLIPKEKLQLLFNKGLKRQQVAKILNCTDMTVGNYVRRYKLEVRK
jgi:transposase